MMKMSARQHSDMSERLIIRAEYANFADSLRQDIQNNKTMGVSALKRKDRKNKSRANNRQQRIKQLLARPEIKNVDVEAIKAQFAEKKGQATA